MLNNGVSERESYFSGGAEAVRAINGGLISAHRPPICRNALRKVSFLWNTIEIDEKNAPSYINISFL